MVAHGQDVRLHERPGSGAGDALAEAYDRWSALVYSLAGRRTHHHAAGDDVPQDGFVGLWGRPDRYDPERGTLRTWLCLLARRGAIDWIRRTAARERVHASTAARPVTQADIDEALIWETETKVVREAIRA